MASDFYLKASKFYLLVPGVPGNSTAPGYRGHIELLAAVYSMAAERINVNRDGFKETTPSVYRGLNFTTKPGFHSSHLKRASESGAVFESAFLSELKFEKGKLMSVSGYRLSGVSVTVTFTESRRTPQGRVELTEGYFLSFDDQPVPGSVPRYERELKLNG